MDELAAVIAAYFPPDRPVTARELAGGNINRGFVLDDGRHPMVVQRLNPAVFPNPRQVVDNFAILSQHLNDKNFLAARPMATLAGAAFFSAADGALWRGQSFIAEHAPTSRAKPESIGRILARFHCLTADLSPERLPPPIPGFHDTPGYLAKAEQALATVASKREKAEQRWCRRVIDRFRPLVTHFTKAEAAGIISRQVTHGDPKRENFITDENGQALGLFDLDTAAAGFIAHDLGDCLRSLANPAGEEADFDRVRLDLDIYREVTRGYRHQSGPDETGKELHIFEGFLLIAFELGLRRLTDHLGGDRYFRVRDRGDNLRLAMIQFRLAELVAEHEREIRLSCGQ